MRYMPTLSRTVSSPGGEYHTRGLSCRLLGRQVVGPDRLRERAESVALEQADEAGVEPSHEGGPREDETRVDLHQRGARPDLRVRVLRAHHAAAADDGDPAAGPGVAPADHLGRERPERRAAEPSLLPGSRAPLHAPP